MIVTLRLSDDLTTAIDGLAKGAGMTRSAWISRAISDALEIRPAEIRDVPELTTTARNITLRLADNEIAAIETVANAAGLTRAQWLKRTVRWQLWDRAGELRLVPSSHDAIIKLVAQVRAIGRSLNQAVKAMNAAARPNSSLEIDAAARSVIGMKAELSKVIDDAASALSAIASAEASYWTGRRIQQPKRRSKSS
jgi:predicted DNA binding CopG/RHH family protein